MPRQLVANKPQPQAVCLKVWLHARKLWVDFCATRLPDVATTFSKLCFNTRQHASTQVPTNASTNASNKRVKQTLHQSFLTQNKRNNLTQNKRNNNTSG
jgi:hypothetical protein